MKNLLFAALAACTLAAAGCGIKKGDVVGNTSCFGGGDMTAVKLCACADNDDVGSYRCCDPIGDSTCKK